VTDRRDRAGDVPGLGLRYYACEGCDAVHAAPTDPPWCSRCGGESLRELTERLQDRDAGYFSPPGTD
jgi:hypothetical protein